MIVYPYPGSHTGQAGRTAPGRSCPRADGSTRAGTRAGGHGRQLQAGLARPASCHGLAQLGSCPPRARPGQAAALPGRPAGKPPDSRAPAQRARWPAAQLVTGRSRTLAQRTGGQLAASPADRHHPRSLPRGIPRAVPHLGSCSTGHHLGSPGSWQHHPRCRDMRKDPHLVKDAGPSPGSSAARRPTRTRRPGWGSWPG
jgi:hypothetical protein